jgi:hypothetical protein
MIMANVNINGKNPLLLDNANTIRTKAHLGYIRYTKLIFLTNLFSVKFSSYDNVPGSKMLMPDIFLDIDQSEEEKIPTIHIHMKMGHICYWSLKHNLDISALRRYLFTPAVIWGHPRVPSRIIIKPKYLQAHIKVICSQL